MHLLLLNQYGPPDTPPTARLLGELADFLREKGHSVEILSQRESYQGRPASGKGRLRREAAALWSILQAGWRRRSPRPAVILALSSPPGLLVVGALLAWRHRARLAHWAMDLYPELALALGEVPPGAVARAVQTAMNQAYRRCRLVVALDDDMRAHLQRLCRATVRVLEPWPPEAAQAPELERAEATAPRQDRTATAAWTWLYSGNLGRAHEWATLLDAQRLLEERGLPIRLVFQGDGAARPAALARAAELGLQRCDWKGYVADADLLPSLLGAQVLIATQRPETQGLLWPSKLAVLEKLPLPILFVGPERGAIADRLRARGEAGVFQPGGAQAVADWVEQQFRRPPGAHLSINPRSEATDGRAILERWLTECVDDNEF